MANITVSVTDANNITVQLTPVAAQNITIDRGVAGNGIVSIVPVTITTLEYLRITYTNGTVQDVGPLTSTAYIADSPITIVGNTISLATVPISKGGTNAITAAAAIQNLLPSYTGNGSKRLGLNSGATALEWVADGGGTVTSVDVSGGTTGLTTSGGPITGSGTITLAGTLAVANGGTNGTATPTAGAVPYGTGTAYAFTAAGTAGQILQSNGASAPTWANLSSLGVSSFSAGTTGFTPSTATSGAVTLAGTLATTNGGTGLTSFTNGGIVYASSTSALATGSVLTFDGSVFKNTGTITSGGNGCLLALNSAADGIYIVGGNKAYNAFSVGDYGIGSVGALKFASNNAINATLDTSGNLGLGVTPSAWRSGDKVLDVGETISLYYQIGDLGGITNNQYINTSNARVYKKNGYANMYLIGDSGTHKWFNAASGTAGNAISFTQAMTLDASGNLLLGQSSGSGYRLNVKAAFTSGLAGAYIEAGEFNQSVMVLNHTNSGVTSNLFQVQKNGTGVLTLDASGNLLVGKTATGIGNVGAENLANGAVFSTLAGSTGAISSYNLYSTGAGAYRFYVGMDGTINATSIVITAISDQRLKENIRDIDTGLSAIMALKPRRFDWKEGKGQDKKNAAGFIAQEFETVFPECVSTSKAGEDGIEYKNINHETLIPTLVKAIQELKAEIDSLKSQLNGA